VLLFELQSPRRSTFVHRDIPDLTARKLSENATTEGHRGISPPKIPITHKDLKIMYRTAGMQSVLERYKMPS
jgi:hypothetical protein